MNRRDFLQLSTVGAVSCGSGCFCQGEETAPTLSPEELYARFIPTDKGLSDEWLESLVQRGHPLEAPIAYTNNEVDLEVIGMTVGGIGCGTVYLSGDGRLWVWDIFNQHHEGVVPNSRAKAPEGLQTIQNRGPLERDGANFLLPPRASEHMGGVDLFFELADGETRRRLDLTGWSNVSFTGRWPVGRVDFSDTASPVRSSLEAFSPFIPLSLEDSSLPVTVMVYTVTNEDSKTRTIRLSGHLRNPLGQYSGLEALRNSREVLSDRCVGLHHCLTKPDQNDRANATEQLDYGSMSLVFVGDERAEVRADGNEVGVEVALPAGESATLRFLITWHVPNLNASTRQRDRKRHYSARFADSEAVADFVAGELSRLESLTRLWVATWNDSTLPQWFLDRTILTANTLQTQNCLIFEDGQFWAWEGVGCCAGTCGHVWEYAQGHARLFPQIERNLREVTDFGLAQRADGSIQFRGNNNNISAIDSQCGYVMRTLRDQQLSDDPGYLGRVWPACRRAIEYLVDFDERDHRGGLDGLLDGEQHNTLDAEWFGKVHVLCSMYLAALRAGEELASHAGDGDFARRCRTVYELGRENIAKLFNGEFYEQIEDPEHSDAIGVGRGCYIDQVMGQFWANQVGLGRLYNAEHQKTALRSLWKYNFVPHYGNFRSAFSEGRHYATGDDSGLLMCTWPKGGLRNDFKKHWQYAYFNECMTGFEYEVAAHMVAEGDSDLVEHGLAITRAIHDRYSALRGRNPYNEIECSDHYARAGASYAVFLAVGGFEFDQAKGRLAFAPVIQQENFRTPFTTSRAWGVYQQERRQATLRITHGCLTLNQLDLAFTGDSQPQLSLNGRAATLPSLELQRNDVLTVTVPGL
jgi:uncharacterized protein (DUF608 family)